jgi:hypothetical protein
MLKAFGKFPYGNGGWMEQPLRLIQAIEIVENELQRVRDKKQSANNRR